MGCVAAGVDGACESPVVGVRAASPYSDGLVGLNGISAASCCAAAVFFNSCSATGLVPPRLDGGGAENGGAGCDLFARHALGQARQRLARQRGEEADSGELVLGRSGRARAHASRSSSMS